MRSSSIPPLPNPVHLTTSVALVVQMKDPRLYVKALPTHAEREAAARLAAWACISVMCGSEPKTTKIL